MSLEDFSQGLDGFAIKISKYDQRLLFQTLTGASDQTLEKTMMSADQFRNLEHIARQSRVDRKELEMFQEQISKSLKEMDQEFYREVE